MTAKWKCYVINLDRSPERMEKLSGRLKELSLEWTRIAAVDGASIADTLPGFDAKGYDRRHGKLVNPNEVGCYLSHVKAIQEFYDSGDEFGVILEDDVQVSDELEHVVNLSIEHHGMWDMLRLSGREGRMPIPQLQLTDKHQIVAFMFRNTGAYAYALNRHAARQYLDKLLPMKVPYDHEFDRAWVYGIKVRGIMPNGLVYFDGTGGTTIGYDWQKGAKKRKKSQWKRTTVFLYRGFNELCRLGHYFIRGLFIPRT